MVHIIKDGKTAARSANLRGIITRARKVGVDLIGVDEIRGDEWGAIVTFWFLDGSWSVVSFNDFTIARDWTTKRAKRYWDCAVNIRPHPDREQQESELVTEHANCVKCHCAITLTYFAGKRQAWQDYCYDCSSNR